ncbi:hypothetical protein C8Q74DRAFT_1201564 [Fomes fomentarius]|nr:hypothetical protein C8Q74DRAFT_1201564 [Fomes fomentarius]
MLGVYFDDPWTCRVHGKKRQFGKQYHYYRLVLDTIGYSLQRFRGSEELLYATYDLIVLRDAHAQASRRHRDVSLANIVVVREPGRSVRRGYLVDWDASCRTDESGKATALGSAVNSKYFVPKLSCRANLFVLQDTWLFMSIFMLSYRSKERQHTLQDDMESLLYVILHFRLL